MGRVLADFSKWETENSFRLHRKICYGYTMSIARSEKLKRLLAEWEPHTVMTRARLQQLGITPQHTQKYVASRWVEAVGAGVFKRPGAALTWQGALHSLQTQRGLKVHVGALTALAAEGHSHFARPGGEAAFLFCEAGVSLPKWFRDYPWRDRVSLTPTKLLPADIGVREAVVGGFALMTSTPERAILEALHLAPKQTDLVEIFQVLEGLQTLRPKLMQSLLEACTSIKVKRLFLFMAERAALPVVKRLDQNAVQLGSGNRTITPGGAYVAKFGLIVPKELAAHE